ncbi:ADP-ribosylglycohydrolase family protein [Methylobacterium soli]|uniref:Tyrosine specific protein phosphatases domain-containing protein n=1 Tax=Methylobacterium soli TaxID=553447 RepID=A0A6L3T0G7_9HYPH|nr:ADP-ribosylglycohydrolase family protein [Methylobacterium soli]KAB1078061.1 hypothetical protein F6X53_16325 [Methylobacterium soli]GJE42981.1 hypothetical protein AEGHOMDF_2158 [Methylobacterium soli]
MTKDHYHTFFATFGFHSRSLAARHVRTSLSHPMQIGSVRPFLPSGLIGITFCPGKKQEVAASGSWDRDLSVDIKAVQALGAVALVTLIEQHEIDALQVCDIGEVCRRHSIEWLHLPIPDVSIPSAPFETRWAIVGEGLRSRLRNGFNIVVHCKGGLGRAGTVGARLLIELGVEPSRAVQMIREARPGAIETDGQLAYALRQRVVPERQPSTMIADVRDRALGAFVGLAVGDALGTTLEFKPRDTYEHLTDMVGGGPFRLKPGQFTDDTSMALCLADSLIARDGLDERELLERFCRWFELGENSCTGTCFDIGNATSAALSEYRATGDVQAASADPRLGGNGSIMRLSPGAIRYWNDAKKLRDTARRQSATTHPAPEPVDGSEALALLLASLIHGTPLSEALSAKYGPFCERVQAVMDGSWRGKHRDAIRSSGYVIDTLEAAIWAVASTGSFEEAVLRAVNLGDDSDSVGAVCGQIAGAAYGLSGIPERWRQKLVWSDRIKGLADRLFAESCR